MKRFLDEEELSSACVLTQICIHEGRWARYPRSRGKKDLKDELDLNFREMGTGRSWQELSRVVY